MCISVRQTTPPRNGKRYRDAFDAVLAEVGLQRCHVICGVSDHEGAIRCELRLLVSDLDEPLSLVGCSCHAVQLLERFNSFVLSFLACLWLYKTFQRDSGCDLRRLCVKRMMPPLREGESSSDSDSIPLLLPRLMWSSLGEDQAARPMSTPSAFALH